MFQKCAQNPQGAAPWPTGDPKRHPKCHYQSRTYDTRGADRPKSTPTAASRTDQHRHNFNIILILHMWPSLGKSGTLYPNPGAPGAPGYILYFKIMIFYENEDPPSWDILANSPGWLPFSATPKFLIFYFMSNTWRQWNLVQTTWLILDWFSWKYVLFSFLRFNAGCIVFFSPLQCWVCVRDLSEKVSSSIEAAETIQAIKRQKWLVMYFRNGTTLLLNDPWISALRDSTIP